MIILKILYDIDEVSKPSSLYNDRRCDLAARYTRSRVGSECRALAKSHLKQTIREMKIHDQSPEILFRRSNAQRKKQNCGDQDAEILLYLGNSPRISKCETR